MPEWIHNRAEHLLAKNPSMSKSTAFAIATQQGHATGHTPKGYGTAEGRREAKAKFDTPKNDVQKANPGNLDSPKLKSASVGDALLQVIQTTGILEKLGFANSAYAGQPAQNGPGMRSHSQLPPFVAPPIVIKEADWKRLFRGPSEEELKEREYKSRQQTLGTLAATGGVGSVVAAKEALPRLLGSQVLYHGTDSQAAKSIAHSGLDPSLGGTGGSVAEDFSGFVEDSLGKIHASTDKQEARSFAGRLAAHRKGKSSDLAALGSAFLPFDPKGGKTIAVGVPYSDFVNKFEVDNTMPTLGMAPTAYRSSHAVPASRVSGSGSFLSAAFKGRPDSYLSYAKQYPKRLATGVGLAAAAPVLAYGGYRVAKSMLNNRNKHKLELANRKEAGVGVGAGMSTSQYSGPLSYGPFKQTSQIPGFVSPGMTKVDPSLEPGGVKAAAAATGAMSPAAKLSTSQRVGAPKTTGFSGPSIADIAKPKGYGTPLAGAGKNAI